MDHEHANPARAIYGTILVMAVITALSHDDSVTSAQLIAGVLATTFVFWVAHVYAEVLGTRLAGDGGRPTLANVTVAARGQWPLVEAALLPVLCLLDRRRRTRRDQDRGRASRSAPVSWSCSATASPPGGG